MIARCPNCDYEFVIGNETTGQCPRCKIKLAFVKGNEVVEKVDIKKIEQEIDAIPATSRKPDIDIEEIDEGVDIERKVDELIG